MNRKTLLPTVSPLRSAWGLAGLAILAGLVVAGCTSPGHPTPAARMSGGITHFDNLSTTDLTVGDDLTVTDLVTTADLTASDDINLGDDLNIAAGGGIYHATATGEGAVFAAYINTTYATTTTADIVIPANADVVDWSYVVLTAYNDSGTDLINCGTAADPDKYVDGLASASTGRNMALDDTDMQSDESTWGDVGTSAISVHCVYTGQNGNASAGAGRFIIWYRLD